jgi:hypothetical protein
LPASLFTAIAFVTFGWEAPLQIAQFRTFNSSPIGAVLFEQQTISFIERRMLIRWCCYVDDGSCFVRCLKAHGPRSMGLLFCKRHTHPAQWDGLENIQEQWGRLKGGLAKRSALFQRKRVG